MNYYLNGTFLGILLYFAAVILLCFLVFGVALFLFFRLNKKLNLNTKWRIVSISVTIILSVIVFYFLFISVDNYFSDGRIIRIYFVSKKNQKRITVLFRKTYKYWHFKFRLKSYEFYTGQQKGCQDLTGNGYPHEHYYLFSPFKNTNIWGYNLETGFHLIDLFTPKILADEKTILSKNPILGKAIRPDWNDVLNEKTNRIYVINNQGNFFLIDTNLIATNIKDTVKTNNHSIQKKHSPKKSSMARLKWVFKHVRGSPFKILHVAGKQPATNAIKMYVPDIIDRWDEELFTSNKIWLWYLKERKRGALLFLSYLDDRGRELTRIDMRRQFKSHTVPYAVFMRDQKAYLFMSRSQGYKHYTLFALQFDPESGKIIKRINYFK